MKLELSFGEQAVGLNYNPCEIYQVHKCKKEFADVIDRMNYLRVFSDDPEVQRMATIAINEAQSAQMWAVKALTWRTYDAASNNSFPSQTCQEHFAARSHDRLFDPELDQAYQRAS